MLLLLTMCAQPQPPGLRECPCTHVDPEKRLYNQVLTELIEQHFYSSYLPDSANLQIRQVLQLQFPQSSDYKLGSVEFKRYEIVRKNLEATHQNHLFNDSAQFKTFYLDTGSRRELYHFALLPTAQTAQVSVVYTKIHARINSLFSQVVQDDSVAAITQLNLVQSAIAPVDFQLCTAKIVLRPSTSKRPLSWERLTIRFSKIVFNTARTKALLRYDMNCGGNCGFGEILLVEKTNGNWHIKQAEELWIS